MTTPKGAITLAIEALESALPEIEQLIKTGKPSLSHGLILQSLTSLRALVADVSEGLDAAISDLDVVEDGQDKGSAIPASYDDLQTIIEAATILATATQGK